MRLCAAIGIAFLLTGITRPRAAEPITLNHVEATFHAGDPDELDYVINGIEAEPHGWSVIPQLSNPQALVVRCAQPVQAAELDFTLFFHSGRPNNSIAELALSYTTDTEPSLKGNWEPLDVQRFTAEVATLQRAEHGHLRAAYLPDVMTGVVADDTYRVSVLLPGSLATGFRLEVFPLIPYEGGPAWMAWGTPHDFVLTEFRVEVHVRESTNIALHRPVKASHPLFAAIMPEELASGTNDFHRLFAPMTPGALTDGLPSTIAHPRDEGLGTNFYFEIDLGRVATLDHIGLRTRGDGYLDRFSRMLARLYEQDPDSGAAPIWEGTDRADGSHPNAGTVDIIRGDLGNGTFRGRYLRLSSDNPTPLSPQLAEVEVYETRTPEVVSALADGREIPVKGVLDLPPGVRRLSLGLRIPQIGLPPGVAFRWRVEGDLEAWQLSRFMTIDMPCPPAGKTVFEAQALHSDHEWDATICSLPIFTRQHFWQARLFQWLAGVGGLGFVGALAVLLTRIRTARQMAIVKTRAVLAEERTRIARDLHDDLGANLACIGVLTELVEGSLCEPARARVHLEKVYSTVEELARRLRSVVWTVDPVNDTLESLARYLHGYAEEYLGNAGIRCHFMSADAMPEVSLSSSYRHHLLMIAKEALNNAMRHAHATLVTLRIGTARGQIEMEIADNGCSLPAKDALKLGNGLSNMKSRAFQLKGNCEFLAAESGKGTIVRVTVPLPSSD